ncbi:hypothetical protein HaLaN_16958, partial [Haematococcus lacustris]
GPPLTTAAQSRAVLLSLVKAAKAKPVAAAGAVLLARAGSSASQGQGSGVPNMGLVIFMQILTLYCAVFDSVCLIGTGELLCVYWQAAR